MTQHSSKPVDTPERPAPTPSRDSAAFWQGCKDGILMGDRCGDCKTLRHPPRPMCPECQSVAREAIALSGRGTLYSRAKPVYPPIPRFPPGYLIALVDLEEGPRVLSNLCDVAPEEIVIGMPLEVFFVPTDEGGAVHQFRPARTES
jgi:uncharacterized OB-fold protein